MKTYLVGGAVRDKLLGLPIKERDWVVVGATPQEMIAQGYKQVGKDFPVFLHPKTHEEYALARTERKTGKGYTQFACYADPSVTLEDDLKRRDLTINAIAMTMDGELIDPYGGKEDLDRHILRHVSPAFTEDPVRILRVARFAAKFPAFQVYQETNQLMRSMLDAGEVDALVPERVWQEFSRALAADCPRRFFEVLDDCSVLQKLFPEFAAHLSSVRQNSDLISGVSSDPIVRFAAMLYDFTESEVKSFCARYTVPSDYKNLSLLIVRYKDGFKKASTLDAEKLLQIFEQTDALRRPERFQQFLLVCETVLGQQGNEQAKYLQEILQLIQGVDVKKILEFGGNLMGEEIRAAITAARIQIIQAFKKRNTNSP